MKSRIFLCALLSGTMAFSQVEDSIQTDSTAIEFDFVEIVQRLPLTSERIGKNELNQQHLGQDIPTLLQNTTSSITTSDASTGIGYSSMIVRRIRHGQFNIIITGDI